MVICRNAEKVHGQRKVVKPCARATKLCSIQYQHKVLRRHLHFVLRVSCILFIVLLTRCIICKSNPSYYV